MSLYLTQIVTIIIWILIINCDNYYSLHGYVSNYCRHNEIINLQDFELLVQTLELLMQVEFDH